MISDGLADPMHKIASSHATTALSQRRDDFHSPGIARPCHRSHSQIPLFRFLVTAVLVVPTLAQSCISLAASTQCPAFNASSISLDRSLTELYPFLGQVSDVASFDSGIQSYVAGDFTQRRYQQQIGCSAIDMANTTSYYARYTTSVLCNGIVQNSINPCGLRGGATKPLCADSCAQYAQSEREIAESSLCGTAGPNADSQIRADLTNCALPANSLSGTCIPGVANEPNDCGYADSITGLCGYCAASSPNATDSCCVFSRSETRCVGVRLAITSTSSSTANDSSAATPSSTTGALGNSTKDAGLSGGQIAGVVVGSVLGALLLLTLLILGCLFYRRRHRDDATVSSLDGSDGRMERSPFAMTNDVAGINEKDPEISSYGGRVTRMSALEGGETSLQSGHPALGYTQQDTSQDSTPESGRHYGVAAAPTRAGSAMPRNIDSLVAADGLPASPDASNDGSARLGAFRDYYSDDMLRAGDLVSTLWAYQPTADDEFELQRGDVLKVSGIWDDGWATGVRVRMRAHDWRPSSTVQRDSGMSHDDSPDNSPDPESEVKAFPLVCVCSPRQWQKTIEGDTTTTTDGTVTTDGGDASALHR